MSKNKPTPGSRAKKKPEVSLVRSSAAEYLTFVAAAGNSDASVEMRYEDENIWLTQKMMAALYDVSVPAINQHLKRLLSDNELEPEATVKKYLIVQTEGDRQVQRSVEHYNLQAIIAGQLFYSTQIPVCLWFLAKDKSGRGLQSAGNPKNGLKSGTTLCDRRQQKLFIDARKLGTLSPKLGTGKARPFFQSQLN